MLNTILKSVSDINSQIPRLDLLIATWIYLKNILSSEIFSIKKKIRSIAQCHLCKHEIHGYKEIIGFSKCIYKNKRIYSECIRIAVYSSERDKSRK